MNVLKNLTAGHALFETVIGCCGIAWTKNGVRALQLPEANRKKTLEKLLSRAGLPEKSRPPSWARRLIRNIQTHLKGNTRDFSGIPLDIPDIPPFYGLVYKAARSIPSGSACTYGELAEKLRRPRSARAVGQAMAKNPVPIIIPCHRVLGAGGNLGGFSAFRGLAMKKKLLRIEKVRGKNQK
ncbi:MAG: methylated-DNA--[protein]-cysteine S-methyltransferase [Elusimicrobia bacterium]|nr:methylated-DNA--[protein]-cysteine S-methyltransferase [Elusimicrobiota bacterium]